MKQGILSQYMMSDARQAGRGLLASLESIEEMELGEEKKADAIEEASSLALRIGRDFPEDSDMHQSMFKVLENMGATEGANVSNESLLGLATKLSGFWRKPKPDSKQISDEEKTDWSKRQQAILQFIKDMEKTYLNTVWLGKQKYVQGTVPAKDFSGAFQLDGKPVTDPLANIEQHKKNTGAFIKAWHGVLANLNTQVQAIHQRTVKATAGAALDDEAAIDIVRKAVDELNTLPDPTAKFPSFSGTALSNMVPVINTRFSVPVVNVEAKMPMSPSDTLPALDKDGVLKVAKLVVEMMKNPDFWPHMEWIRWLDFKDGSKFSDWIYDADNSVYMDYYHRFYWQGANDAWSDDIFALNSHYRVIIGLIKWMDRSIK
jgi:hypothetical protein